MVDFGGWSGQDVVMGRGMSTLGIAWCVSSQRHMGRWADGTRVEDVPKEWPLVGV